MEARVRIALRWRDMDMLGHLNQSVYHELLEEARAALFAPLFEQGGWSFVLVRVELDHRREVRRDHGHVDVVARVAPQAALDDTLVLRAARRVQEQLEAAQAHGR